MALMDLCRYINLTTISSLYINNVREDIRGELEAVILYEQEYIDIPCKDIRQVFLFLIKHSCNA